MSLNGKEDQFRLGFLTALELSDHAYVGGLLVTNRFGRPLEFQCTRPVKPNRIQAILYGPTLVPFVLGELIGLTLVDKAQVKPHLVLTDQPEILELRNHICLPVACLADDDSQKEESDRFSADSVRLGRQQIHFHAAHESDRRVVEESSELIPCDANLREPFQRVEEALNESIRSGATR